MSKGGGRLERDLLIVRQVLAGATLERVADEHGLTRQRVSQIMRSRCPDWDGVLRRSKKAAARARRRDPEVVAGPAEHGPDAHGAGRPPQWTDEAILAQLAAAAQGGRALPVAAWRLSGNRPSAATVIARFGSWSAACAAAGLATARSPVHGTPDRALVDAVAAFLSDPTPGRDRGGVRAYAAWARRTGAPSPTVLRNRFGSWSAAKALALAHLARTRGNGPVL